MATYDDVIWYSNMQILIVQISTHTHTQIHTFGSFCCYLENTCVSIFGSKVKQWFLLDFM